jgi:hypothetical protein
LIISWKVDHPWCCSPLLHQSFLLMMCQDLSSFLQLTTSSSFKKKKKGLAIVFLPFSFKKTPLMTILP